MFDRFKKKAVDDTLPLENDRSLIDRLITLKVAEHEAHKKKYPDYVEEREIARRPGELEEQIRSRSLKVVFTSPAFKVFPALIQSLQSQTYPNWELILVHDGPCDDELRYRIDATADSRINLFELEQRYNDWGHTPRKYAIDRIREQFPCDSVVMTNSDNYYVPGFIERMLRSFDSMAQVAFCDMVHDYYGWTPISTKLEYSHIDCGCLMLRREAVLSVGWRSLLYEADWIFVHDLMQRYGEDVFRKVNAALFVHN